MRHRPTGSFPTLAVTRMPGRAHTEGDMKPNRASSRRPLATSPFKAPVIAPLEQYKLKDRVTHDTYGLGWVVGVEVDIAVLVDFGQGEPRRIVAPYDRLSRL